MNARRIATMVAVCFATYVIGVAASHAWPYGGELFMFWAGMAYAAWLTHATTQTTSEADRFRRALDRAAYALFQIKRLPADAVHDFASSAHEAACRELNS